MKTFSICGLILGKKSINRYANGLVDLQLYLYIAHTQDIILEFYEVIKFFRLVFWWNMAKANTNGLMNIQINSVFTLNYFYSIYR